MSQWVERLSVDLDDPQRCLFVAAGDRTIVGYGRGCRFTPAADAPANVAPSGYYLTGVVVDPAHRREGIGAKLIEARCQWAGRRGGREIWFFTNAANTASLLLHQNFGFEEVTRDFVFPGVQFAGGEGILCRAGLRRSAHAW